MTSSESAASKSVFMAGDMIRDRYLLDELIATGSMGHVFSATDTSLGRKVAIKLARRMRELTGELERRLLLEARAAAKLRGLHVAHVFEIGRVPSGLPFVVMEFLEGENLEAVLERRQRVQVAEAVNWTLQTCLALAEAHTMGIVHRDIKPENLFLAETPDGDRVLKVLDFGASAFVATEFRIGTSDEMHVGTPLYMSPERIRDASSCDLRSDIWALGAVIYELLVGRPPFDSEGADVKEIIQKTLNDEPEPLASALPGISPHLDATVRRCLAKDPDDRFNDVGELAKALARSATAGAQGLAMRVTRVLERAAASSPEPAASQAHLPVPTPRPPSPTLPFELTADDAAAPSPPKAPRKGATMPRARPPMASEPLLLTSRIDDDE